MKLLNLLWSCDAASAQASAFGMLEELNKTSNSSTFLLPCGEMVHIEKKLLHSTTNWWLINEGCRINSGIIRSVRHGNDKIWQNRSLRIYVTLRGRDRMDFGIVLEFSYSGLLQLLNKCENTIAVTVYPDPFWLSSTTVTFNNPSSICIGPNKILLILDNTSDKKSLLSLRLHNPVEAKVLLQINDQLSDMTYHDRIIFLDT